MHTRRVLSAHGACSGSLCTGNREGKRGPVLFHLFQLEGNGGRQQRRNRSQRNHTRTDAVGPAQGACRGNRSTKSAEEPKKGTNWRRWWHMGNHLLSKSSWPR